MILVNEQAVSITLDDGVEYYVGDYEMIIKVTNDQASIFDAPKWNLTLKGKSNAKSIK